MSDDEAARNRRPRCAPENRRERRLAGVLKAVVVVVVALREMKQTANADASRHALVVYGILPAGVTRLPLGF